jgi:hypothetical protein
MTSEEMQRAMDFIVEMQAKSSAKIVALGENLRQSQSEWDERSKRTDERITALLAIAEIHEREIMANSEHISSLSRDVAILGQTTKATDERLNALINVVERQIAERRNGK